ncbi:LYAM2-like protein [Mya arenaria]|uniref:LYAM2-like protein n=1 Tax=Mya arenaria TaxID=6604 RepID=A0ABY7EAX6_MYAAR|nr:LYAM2-like protein [Mya arenaria]
MDVGRVFNRIGRTNASRYAYVLTDNATDINRNTEVIANIILRTSQSIHLDTLCVGENTTCLSGFAHKIPSYADIKEFANKLFKKPICDCGGLSRPDNGHGAITGTFYGDEARFTCLEGYRLVGREALSCQLYGNWSAEPPVCELISGPNISDPTVIRLPVEHDFECGFHNHDFVMAIPITRNLSAEQFNIMKTFAKTLLNNTDLTVRTRAGMFIYTNQVQTSMTINLNDFNSKREFMRALDIIPFIGTSEDTSAEQALVQLKRMLDEASTRVNVTKYAFLGVNPQVNMPSNAFVENLFNGSDIHLDVLAVGFDDAALASYIPFNDTSHVWSVPSFDALESIVIPSMFKNSKCDCGMPTTPVHGNKVVTGTFYMDTATFGCDRWYELEGPRVITCGHTVTPTAEPVAHIYDCGLQDIDMIIAIAVSPLYNEANFNNCGVPSQPVNGRVTYTGTFFLDKAAFACDAGFDLSGVPIVVLKM